MMMLFLLAYGVNVYQQHFKKTSGNFISEWYRYVIITSALLNDE